MIYIFLIFIALIFSNFSHKSKYKTLFFWTAIIIMTLMCGLRSEEVGRDTQTYIEVYSGDVDGSRFGILWNSIILLCHAITDDYTIYLFVMAIITFVPLGSILNKTSYLPAVSLLAFMVSTNRLFLETFNICRQMAAIVWVIYASYYWINNKRKETLIAVAIAVLLHKITFLSIPFIALSKKKISPSVVYTIIPLSIIFGFIGTSSLVNYILSFLSGVSSGPLSYIATFGGYIYRELESGWSVSEMLAHSLPLSALCILSYKSFYSNSTSTHIDTFKHILIVRGVDYVYYNMTFYGTVLCNLLITNVFCDRISNALTIFHVIVFGNAIKKSGGIRKILLVLLLIACVLFFFKNIISMSNHPGLGEVFPYSSEHLS